MKRILGAAIVSLIVCGGYFWRRERHNYPPALIVPGSLSQGPLRVFGGQGASLFILPDGSLWHWGRSFGGGVKVVVPERLGTNTDWREVQQTYNGFVGIRADGTLWRDKHGYTGSQAELDQVGSAQDWVDVTAIGQDSFAIRRDGTLWAWGDNSRGQLGNGPGPNQTNLVQVGTDSNWAAVRCTWSATLALRKDGTLWAWGQAYYTAKNPPTSVNLPTPAQVSSDTNWTGFTMGFFLMPRNRAGEVWEPFRAAPNADLPAAVTCGLVATNALPDRLATAFVGKPYLYQIHADGTLWQRFYPFSIWATEPAGEWRKIGNRSDWLSIQGGGSTVFGVTSDGTLWTWGVDPNLEPIPTFSMRLKLFQERLKGLIGGSPPGNMYQGGMPQYEEEPRALIKLTGK